MKLKNKKKLPKYALGTIKPKVLGYLLNRGLGVQEFTSTPGENLEPETRALKSSYIPNSLGRLQLNAQYPTLALLNMKTVTTPSSVFMPTLKAAAANPLTSSLSATTSNLGTSLGGNLGAKGLGGLGSAAAGDAAEFFGTSGLLLPSPALGAAGSTSHVLNAAGTAAAVAGTAYGAYNVINDIANADSRRSAADMRNTLTTKTYTTAGGNQYTAHSGLNTDTELDYEREQTKLKQTNLMLDSMGLGASAGSFFGPVGTGVGAALGLLGGGLASLFGFGDNEEDVKALAQAVTDHTSMEAQQNRSVAESKDRRAGAANGKQPVYSPIGKILGKATARVSNGELIGNFEDGYISRVPGLKNNKDTKLAALKSSDFVISNKYGLSDYAAATGDYIGALNMLEKMLHSYKNGKLPKCANGWADTLFSMAPHFVSFAQNLELYNRAKEADVMAPDTYVDNPEGTRAVNELAQLRFDSDPYYREAQKAMNWANYNNRRNVGIGQGGRMIMANSMFNGYLDKLANINKVANEANAGYRTAYAQALANLGATNQGRRMEANAKRHLWMQQAMGARENWMAQYRKNIDQNLLNAAAEYMRQGQYRDSLAAQNRMLDLYDRLARLDEAKFQASLPKYDNDVSSLLKSYDAIRNLTYIPGLGITRSFR